MEIYYKLCNVEKIYQFEGFFQVRDFKQVKEVALVVDIDDKGPYSDHVKVKIKIKDSDKILGILNKDDGKQIYNILLNRWDEVFCGYIVKWDEDEVDENKKIQIVIKIKEKKDGEEKDREEKDGEEKDREKKE